MIIAERILSLDGAGTQISVRIFRPEGAGLNWRCTFEIDWPENPVKRWGEGVDAVQALLHALQMIGAQIYASPYHREDRLQWLDSGLGYGFPVPNNIRDALIGDDARYL